jgi:hypothetical protein
MQLLKFCMRNRSSRSRLMGGSQSTRLVQPEVLRDEANAAANYAALCAPKHNNVFKSRPAHAVPPWEGVERAVSHGSTAKEEEDNLFVPPSGYDSDDGSAECRKAWYKYVTAYPQYTTFQLALDMEPQLRGICHNLNLSIGTLLLTCP